MDYTLRTLKSTDIFTFVKIVNKIGFKEFSTVYDGVEEKDGNQMMLEIIAIVLENLETCKPELYKFLSDLSGMKVKELEDIKPATFMQMIIDVYEKEEFEDFFKVASKLFK